MRNCGWYAQVFLHLVMFFRIFSQSRQTNHSEVFCVLSMLSCSVLSVLYSWPCFARLLRELTQTYVSAIISSSRHLYTSLGCIHHYPPLSYQDPMCSFLQSSLHFLQNAIIKDIYTYALIKAWNWHRKEIKLYNHTSHLRSTTRHFGMEWWSFHTALCEKNTWYKIL